MLRKNRSVRNLGDVTLNDFANSSVCKNRIKKSASNINSVFNKSNEQKDPKGTALLTEEFESDYLKGIHDKGNIYVELRPSKSALINKDIRDTTSGEDYPIDIWFILAEYIRPQDVGRFAAICKTSYEVVSSAKFWYSLYKRYYTNVPNIPEQLQPACLVRKYGLRTSVIRALHYTYPPFIEKLKSSINGMKDHPDTLRNRQCHSLWHQKQKTHWIFYFKMKIQDNFLRQPKRNIVKHSNLLEMLDDVTANLEEHYCILQVTSKHFIQIPPVIGQVLTFATVTLSQDFRHHKLQLEFGSGIHNRSKGNSAGGTSIILDPVINFRVLNWWHPLYPHSHTIHNLLNQD